MRTRKFVLLTLPVVLLVLGVFLWLGRSAPEDAGGVQPDGATAAGPDDGEPSWTPGERTEGAGDERAELEPDDGGEGEPTQRPVPAGGREFSGTWIVERADGRVDLEADGGFVFATFGDRGASQRITARAVNGRWSVQLRADVLATLGSVAVRMPQVDGRAALLLEPKDRTALVDGLVVRVRESTRTLLRVVDAATRTDLAPVLLCRPGGALERHPGPRESRAPRQVAGDAGELRSPIDLADFKGLGPGARTVLVGCAGYAWAPVTVEVGSGTERTVELVPGGDLRLHLSSVPDPGLQLRLWGPEGRGTPPLVDAALGELQELELDGLAPGPFQVTVERGSWSEPSVVLLARADALVHAGGVTDVSLDLARAPEVGRVDLELEIQIASAWQTERLNPRLNLLGESIDGPGAHTLRAEREADRDGVRLFRARALGLEAGEYLLELFDPPHNELLELRAGAPARLRIEVPAPAEVTLQLHDFDSGEPARPAWVGWGTRGDDGNLRAGLQRVEFSSELDGYRLRVPAGELLLVAPHSSGLEFVDGQLSATPGAQAARRAVRRVTEVQVVLLDQGVPQPFPADWRAHFTRRDTGAAVPEARVYDGASYLSRLPSGGSYRVDFDPLPGYEPLEPIDCELPDRTRSKIELELKKRP